MKFLHVAFLIAVAAGITVPSPLGVSLIQPELERGIALAHVAATAQSVFYAQATEVYGQVRTLLPRISFLKEPERAALAARVADLRMALDLVPGAADHARAPGVVYPHFTS